MYELFACIYFWVKSIVSSALQPRYKWRTTPFVYQKSCSQSAGGTTMMSIQLTARASLPDYGVYNYKVYGIEYIIKTKK
jgi:hypothetical protein